MAIRKQATVTSLLRARAENKAPGISGSVPDRAPSVAASRNSVGRARDTILRHGWLAAKARPAARKGISLSRSVSRALLWGTAIRFGICIVSSKIKNIRANEAAARRH